jgi:large subunit ribosomal protein L21
MKSVVEIQGKQWTVTSDTKLVVDRIDAEVGQMVTFPNILDAGELKAEVVEHILGDKIVTRKFRNKTRYQRTKGHRQHQTVLVFRDSATGTAPARKTRSKSTNE